VWQLSAGLPFFSVCRGFLVDLLAAVSEMFGKFAIFYLQTIVVLSKIFL